MKKVFLTLALAAFAFAANAQFVVSGNLGFNHTSDQNIRDGKTDYSGNPEKTSSFELSLRGGCMITEKLTVGIDFGFGFSGNTKNESSYPGTDVNAVSTTVWTKNPVLGFDLFARYNAFQVGKITAFAETTVGFSTVQNKWKVESHALASTTEVVLTRTNTLSIEVVPGLNYALNEHWSMDVYLEFMGLGFYHQKDSWTDGTDVKKYDGKNYDVTNTFDLSINNGQISGVGLATGVRFGINYAF